jgi:hypothetical protein
MILKPLLIHWKATIIGGAKEEDVSTCVISSLMTNSFIMNAIMLSNTIAFY